MYNVLTTVLTNKLKMVVENVIFETRYFFVTSKKILDEILIILDEILITNKVVIETRNSNKKFIFLKFILGEKIGEY